MTFSGISPLAVSWSSGTMRRARLQAGKPCIRYLPSPSRQRSKFAAARCVSDFGDRLLKAESDGDAIVALEVLAEASALKAVIPPAAAEAGARAVSDLSAQRALQAVQQHVLDQGEQPCFKSTIPAISRALGKSQDQEGFAALLNAVEPNLLAVCADEDSKYSMEEQHDCMKCMNLMLRMQGKVDIDAAVEKVNRYHKLGIIIEGATYTQLAASSLTAGNFPQAEELLEMRDYL